MRLGAHVSTAGGLEKAVDRALAMGAEAIQVFGSSPQSWAFREVPEAQVEAFREKLTTSGVHPVFLHAIYLVNLGSPAAENLSKSVQALVNYTVLAGRIGARGVIFHAGSHRGAGYEGIFKQTVQAIESVLAASPAGVELLMENSAGMGQHIGSRFQEIGQIIKAVGSERLKVCLDTEHAFAAGYNVADRQGIQEAMAEFDREIGLDRLVAVHANDAKVPLGSGVDRHENIGEGHIGEAGFEVIMAHPAFRDVPFLLEVPGVDGGGPDKPNLDRLKAIRARLSRL
ncbi:MAG: deoxyribonuclease IV [Chloroflexi bacterium]|nr:deoxyribonuclease IV [Chloroflexota bacterium]